MRVYFETELLGEEVKVTALSQNDFRIEPDTIRVSIITKGNELIPLHKYIDDPDEIERITDAAINDLQNAI